MGENVLFLNDIHHKTGGILIVYLQYFKYRFTSLGIPLTYKYRLKTMEGPSEKPSCTLYIVVFLTSVKYRPCNRHADHANLQPEWQQVLGFSSMLLDMNHLARFWQEINVPARLHAQGIFYPVISQGLSPLVILCGEELIYVLIHTKCLQSACHDVSVINVYGICMYK